MLTTKGLKQEEGTSYPYFHWGCHEQTIQWFTIESSGSNEWEEHFYRRTSVSFLEEKAFLYHWPEESNINNTLSLLSSLTTTSSFFFSPFHKTPNPGWWESQLCNQSPAKGNTQWLNYMGTCAMQTSTSELITVGSFSRWESRENTRMSVEDESAQDAGV